MQQTTTQNTFAKNWLSKNNYTNAVWALLALRNASDRGQVSIPKLVANYARKVSKMYVSGKVTMEDLAY